MDDDKLQAAFLAMFNALSPEDQAEQLAEWEALAALEKLTVAMRKLPAWRMDNLKRWIEHRVAFTAAEKR